MKFSTPQVFKGTIQYFTVAHAVQFQWDSGISVPERSPKILGQGPKKHLFQNPSILLLHIPKEDMFFADPNGWEPTQLNLQTW